MTELTQHSLEVVEKVAANTAIATGSGTGLYGLVFNEWLALAGFGVAVISLALDFWFKKKRLKLIEEQGKDL